MVFLIVCCAQVYALTSFIEANNFAQGKVAEMWGESSGGKTNSIYLELDWAGNLCCYFSCTTTDFACRSLCAPRDGARYAGVTRLGEGGQNSAGHAGPGHGYEVS